MKSCEAYQELISRMLDGDLSRSERNELAEHVKVCPDCAAVYVAFRSLSEHLGEELEEVPASVHENVMAEIRRDQIRRKNTAQHAHRRWHAVLTAAACLVLVVAAGLSFPKLAARRANMTTAQSAPAAVEASEPEQPMLFAPAPNPADSVQNGDADDAYGLFRDDMAAAEENAPKEAPAEVPEQEKTAVVMNENGELVLDQATSKALMALLTRESTPLDGETTHELHLLVLKDGVQRPLTVLLTEKEAVWVFADGDVYFRIDASPSELLKLLEQEE